MKIGLTFVLVLLILFYSAIYSKIELTEFVTALISLVYLCLLCFLAVFLQESARSPKVKRAIQFVFFGFFFGFLLAFNALRPPIPPRDWPKDPSVYQYIALQEQNNKPFGYIHINALKTSWHGKLAIILGIETIGTAVGGLTGFLSGLIINQAMKIKRKKERMRRSLARKSFRVY